MSAETVTETKDGKLRAVLCAFLDVVREAGTLGAPAGPVYAAVMGRMTLEQFEMIMGALVATGRVRRSGHVYHYVREL